MTTWTRHRHSPLVRRLAALQGVDPDTLAGTGPAGRVTRADVLSAARATVGPAARTWSTTGPPIPMPAHMSVPVTASVAASVAVVEVDVSAIVAPRTRVGDVGSTGPPPPLLAHVAWAGLRALKAYPGVGAGPHLGVTVQSGHGEIVAVIPHAADLTVAGLARHLAKLAEQARAGTLGADELTGATLTVADLGRLGALLVTPAGPPSQAAALSIGEVVRRPVVVTDEYGDEGVGIRSMVFLTLVYDHRVVTMAAAAGLLATVKTMVQTPPRVGEAAHLSSSSVRGRGQPRPGS